MKILQPEKVFHQNQGRVYYAPEHIAPFDAIPMAPSHAGLLALIREAKDENHHWADAALAEVSFLTGINYKFVRTFKPFEFQHHEIEATP